MHAKTRKKQHWTGITLPARVLALLRDYRSAHRLLAIFREASAGKIDTGSMGTNDRHACGHPQTLYGDVMIWLRDNGFGKDHDLAAMIIGNHAIDHSYNGVANGDLFTPDELEILGIMFHDFKDYNRSSADLVGKAMALEQKLIRLTGCRYEPDTTYDMKTPDSVNLPKEGIDSAEKFFEVTSVSREDLDKLGFDTSDVTDETMRELASKLSDDYCEQFYWDSLQTIAEELDIPEKTK